MSDPTLAGKAGDNSFIANLKEGLSAGFKTIGTEVLPIWARKQVAGESKDKLAQPTYDGSGIGAGLRIDQLASKVGGGNPAIGVAVMLAVGVGVGLLIWRATR